MAVVIKAPGDISCLESDPKPSVFLAGSIDMGKAVDWQKEITQRLAPLDIYILNPRRDDWDSSWNQSIDDPQFRQQVEWELECQEKATIIAMNFSAESQAPISLLELGLFAKSGKMVVCCPEGYHRKGNVDVTCHKYGVEQVNDLDMLADVVALKVIENQLVNKHNDSN